MGIVERELEICNIKIPFRLEMGRMLEISRILNKEGLVEYISNNKESAKSIMMRETVRDRLGNYRQGKGINLHRLIEMHREGRVCGEFISDDYRLVCNIGSRGEIGFEFTQKFIIDEQNERLKSCETPRGKDKLTDRDALRKQIEDYYKHTDISKIVKDKNWLDRDNYYYCRVGNEIIGISKSNIGKSKGKYYSKVSNCHPKKNITCKVDYRGITKFREPRELDMGDGYGEVVGKEYFYYKDLATKLDVLVMYNKYIKNKKIECVGGRLKVGDVDITNEMDQQDRCKEFKRLYEKYRISDYSAYIPAEEFDKVVDIPENIESYYDFDLKHKYAIPSYCFLDIEKLRKKKTSVIVVKVPHKAGFGASRVYNLERLEKILGYKIKYIKLISDEN